MIGKRLTEIRNTRNLSMVKMAEFLSLPYASYLKYERDERFPEPERLTGIANKLEVSIDYLMGNSAYKERVEEFAHKNQPSFDMQRLIISQIEAQQELSRVSMHREMYKHQIEELKQRITDNPNPVDQKTLEIYRMELAVAEHDYVRLNQNLRELQDKIHDLVAKQ